MTPEEKTPGEPMKREPLHRMSGGSASGAGKPPCCPRCGERLRRLGRFDPKRMEIVVSDDGVSEWRWKPGAERRT